MTVSSQKMPVAKLPALVYICRAHGKNPALRIALCGYDTEHAGLDAAGWTVLHWQAQGGLANQFAEKR